MTEIMPVPRILILLSYQQGAFLITFFAGGPGKISISPLRPPCTPRNPIETIAPRGVRHCTPCLYCTKRRHHLWGGAAERKRSLGGNSKTARRLRAVPLSATHFVRVHFPRTRGQLLGGVTASLPCRGRWMRAKRADGGVAAWLLLFTSTPQSIRLAAYCQLPGRGVFGRYTQTLVQSRRAANDGPYSTSYKPLAKTRGRTASTISSQSLTLTRRKADFTLRKQYFTARQRNFTRS